MTDTPPDRLSINPRSPHFGGELLERGIAIRFKGVQRHDVEEYCLSEGWIRVAAGKSRDRYGQAMTIKMSGPVGAWFDDVGEGGGNAAGNGTSSLASPNANIGADAGEP